MDVLVVGGGTGIGKAVATAVVRSGGKAVVAGRRKDPLFNLAAEFPNKIFALPCDITVPADRGLVMTRAAEALGGLDGFVYSAGIVAHQLPGGITDDDLQEQLEVNLIAPLRLGEQALRGGLRVGGSVVMMTSTLARRPIMSSAAYSASKAGLREVVKTLAIAGAGRGIRFNCVCPGVVDTDMLTGDREGNPEGASVREHLMTLQPLGRIGQTHEIADAVMYLLAASWVTGTELVIDGGGLLRE
jgi:NAD(P)-dependent dehydrogenase (short-subunit alcohol dehydrogenase family)